MQSPQSSRYVWRDGRAFSEQVDVPLGIRVARSRMRIDAETRHLRCPSADVATVDALWNRLERLDGENDWWTLAAQVA